jgi:quercetin dioxygenase-like cupin family protein
MNSVPQQPAANPRYKIKQSLVIAQCDEMRVIDQTLAPGECVPWHLHPLTDDYILCLRGELQVRCVDPDELTTLRPLEQFVIPKGRPHSTANASAGDCQFLIVQGPGRVEFCAIPEPESRGK